MTALPVAGPATQQPTPAGRQLIQAEIERTPGIAALLELLTMQMGPDHLIIAVRVALDDEVSADQAEDLADDIDRRLADRLEPTSHVFVDPTQAAATASPQ